MIEEMQHLQRKKIIIVSAEGRLRLAASKERFAKEQWQKASLIQEGTSDRYIRTKNSPKNSSEEDPIVLLDCE